MRPTTRAAYSFTVQGTGDHGQPDANDELAGTPSTVGTYTFTMRVSDYHGHKATQRFSLTIDPPSGQ